LIRKWFIKCVKEALTEVMSGLGFENETKKGEEKNITPLSETENDGAFTGMSREIFDEWLYGKVNDEEH